MAGRLRTERVLAALLNMAIRQRRAQGVVHHIDQGAQYTSISFGAAVPAGRRVTVDRRGGDTK